DTGGWLAEKLGDRAPNEGGPIVDGTTGEELGRHEGTYRYTIGQRRGLRLGRPAPDGKPRFVLDIEPVSGTVTVGPREALTVDRIRRCGTPLTDPLEGTVQLRAHGAEHRARVGVDGALLHVDLRDPADGNAPGQAVVVYDGTRVVGSATIVETGRG